MNPEDENEYNITDINIHSFNNKADKGDDDFNYWMEHEAPFNTTTVNTMSDTTVSISDYTTSTIDISSLTSGNETVTFGKNINSSSVKKLAYTVPIDILHKWFPNEIKKDESNDDIPF